MSDERQVAAPSTVGSMGAGYPLKPSEPHWCEYVDGKCCMCGADDPWERYGGVAHRLRKAAELGQRGAPEDGR